MPTPDTELILIDTNVLVYALDPADHIKQRIAIDLLDELAGNGRGSLSVQCLTECFNAITRRIAQPIPAAIAGEHIADFASTFTVFELTGAIVVGACEAVASAQISLWDALIWSLARHHFISTILTEDMQHRSSIGSVRYLNPFDREFDLALVLAGDFS